MKHIYLLSAFIIALSSCSPQINENFLDFPQEVHKVIITPKKQKLWVFIMAGQSNMAGRGKVQPQDTMENSRILTINKEGNLIYAKEPLHFYEPKESGLDCGMSFATSLLESVPDDISILLIPAAVGGSHIQQWLKDSLHRDVKLLTNFKQKSVLAMRYGMLKGIIWHQGESDATLSRIPTYQSNIKKLFTIFRRINKNTTLPIVLGEVGSFATDKRAFASINTIINAYSLTDIYTRVVKTDDLGDRGDNLHFNSKGQRAMGTRYAEQYLNLTAKPVAMVD